MVTVGRGVLDPAVHEFFDAVRSYDAKRAAAKLAEDVDFDSPWSGRLSGRAAVEAFLQPWLADAKTRPTFSIIDVQGDGAVTRMKVSVSGRFGKAPEHLWMEALCLKHVLHQVAFRPVGGAPGHH